MKDCNRLFGQTTDSFGLTVTASGITAVSEDILFHIFDGYYRKQTPFVGQINVRQTGFLCIKLNVYTAFLCHTENMRRSRAALHGHAKKRLFSYSDAFSVFFLPTTIITIPAAARSTDKICDTRNAPRYSESVRSPSIMARPMPYHVIYPQNSSP